MRIRACLIALCWTVSGAHAAQKEVPSWVPEIASRSLPAYPGRVPAAMIFCERHVTVDASGTVTKTTREAIKILTHEGQKEAEADEYYFAANRKIKDLQAWLVAPSGFVKTFDRNSVADIGAFNGMELYNDIRLRRIRADNPELGAVFVYESTVEEKSLFAQDDYEFQTNLPALQSRYVLTIPAGWKARGMMFNSSAVQPLIDGTTYTWELKSLPYREEEEHGTSMRGAVPWLAVDFDVPASAEGVGTACCHSWADVSRWQAKLSSGQDAATPEMTAEVQRLISNSKTEYEKVQAVGQYVQKLKYVAIEMDLGRGGGYKPHTADSVFRMQYGDCKDKANLMRAMLKAAGIQSYLVAIFSGDRTYVREEWPSVTQFNHMILAVRVSPGTAAPTVLSTDATGNLLIFDPTSETTPLGDLPWYEQGSLALLCADANGTILKMPAVDAKSNSIDVSVSADLSEAGSLSVKYVSARRGQPAASARAEHLYATPEQYRSHLERALARDAKQVTLGKFEFEDSFPQNTLRQTVEFQSQAYAQLIQRRLLVFSASVVEPAAYSFPRVDSRTEPIVLRAQSYRKHLRMKLPVGFTADELPESAKSENEFGRFYLSFKQEGTELVMEESLETQAVTLPAEQYAKVKKFFDEFAGADHQTAVLVKN